MGVKLYGWAWARVGDVSPVSHHVLLALAEFADKAGVCFPSHTTLAAKTGWGERTVRRSLAELESAGLLERSRRRRRDGSRTSDEIRLLWDSPAASRAADETELRAGESDRAAVRSHASGGYDRARGTHQENSSGVPSEIPAHLHAAFKEFTDAYPSQAHDGTADAWPAFSRAARSGVDPRTIAEGARAYAMSRAHEDPRFTQSMRRWLDTRGWERPYAPAFSPLLNTRSQKIMALMAHNQLLERDDAEV